MQTAEHLILACHITGVYDVNRSNTLPSDDYSLVKSWADSIIQHDLNGIIFHNNFSDETVLLYQNTHIQFVKVDFDSTYSPNVYRYFVYKAFLETELSHIKEIFFTDITDVVVVSNPFISSFYKDNSTKLFCGDEPKVLENDWMKNHSDLLRKRIEDYADYEEKYKNEVLLNCGIVGGNISLMKEFVNQLCTIHSLYNQNNNSGYTGDMGVFNYLVRTKYNDRLFHGPPCNTIFKAYQEDRTDCWFRHK